MSPRLYRLVIQPEATEEVAEAAAWYEERERGLGHEFLRAFRAATSLLRRTPLLFPAVESQTRRVLLRRFPYSVVYQVHGSDVVVLSCFHASRDPRDWQGRISPP